MSKQEHISQMALDLGKLFCKEYKEDGSCVDNYEATASALYDEGYRKMPQRVVYGLRSGKYQLIKDALHSVGYVLERQGYWIKNKGQCECSRCHYVDDRQYAPHNLKHMRYCNYCGAKMIQK